MVVLKAAIVYVCLIILLRLTTRRIMRSATPLDMVIIFLFGGLAVQPIIGEDHSFTNAGLAACTIAGLHVGISALKPHFPLIGRITEGTPVVVFKDGEFDIPRLRKLRVDEKDVAAELRQQGLRSFNEVETVVVEHNGGITIVRKPE